jgi:putative transposase
VAISMDGRGRATDNVFIERLWRSVKYEEIYLKEHAHGAHEGLASWFDFYTHRRPHQGLGGRTPYEVYHDLPACEDRNQSPPTTRNHSRSPHLSLTPPRHLSSYWGPLQAA